PARPRAESPRFTLLRAGGAPAALGAAHDAPPRAFFVRRPPGLQFDSGGLAKGLFADLLAERAVGPFAVDCGGDLRFGGRRRTLEVADPFGGPGLHVFEIFEGAAATSGIGKRSWLDTRGRPAHHLLDPATGTPAFTGVVQTTALAPTAVEAEWRAKAALLSADATWLAAHGGLVVFDDGHHELVPANSQARPTELIRTAPILIS
ncbi:FAD:protein FMN transferase, partial [Solirubrobacter taibaiensis]|nr:FAD:protein FMN transferase [Solirubrobacter taibaiensis]